VSSAELTATAISALANILLAGAAVAAAVAAFSGLSTWKAQNIWVADRETARSLLKALIRLEKVVAKARHPAFWAGETYAFAEDADRDRPAGVVSDRRVERAHYARLNSIHTVYEEVEVLLIEAEALWSDYLKSDWEVINRLLIKYFAQTQLYLSWSASNGENKGRGFFDTQENQKRNSDIVFVDPAEAERNPFSQDFGLAVHTLKSRLGEKMGKRK
jgi:hypothetical protein